MRTVGYYDTPFEAEIARGILESEDIEAMIQNENMGSVLPFGGAISSLIPWRTSVGRRRWSRYTRKWGNPAAWRNVHTGKKKCGKRCSITRSCLSAHVAAYGYAA